MADYDSSLPVRSQADSDERLQSKIVDFTTPAQGAEVDANGDLHVLAKIVDEAGDAFSSSNPLPVEFFENLSEIFDYDTASAVASDATSNHDYTTTGAFKLTEIIASASGKMKAELQIETASGSATFNTVAVGFNSTSSPNIVFAFKYGLNVVSGAIVRIIRTNLDNQAQDLYSTVIGHNP